jgi:hypothetical protein
MRRVGREHRYGCEHAIHDAAAVFAGSCRVAAGAQTHFNVHDLISTGLDARIQSYVLESA